MVDIGQEEYLGRAVDAEGLPDLVVTARLFLASDVGVEEGGEIPPEVAVGGGVAEDEPLRLPAPAGVDVLPLRSHSARAWTTSS